MQPDQIFTGAVLKELFPADRTNDFFDALLGDAEEGAYDITLAYEGCNTTAGTLHFQLQLHERPGRCLACNLTYGLPEVFSRHPLINIRGLVKAIEERLGGDAVCESWQLGATIQQDRKLHLIPLTIRLKKA